MGGGMRREGGREGLQGISCCASIRNEMDAMPTNNTHPGQTAMREAEHVGGNLQGVCLIQGTQVAELNRSMHVVDNFEGLAVTALADHSLKVCVLPCLLGSRSEGGRD